MRRRNKLAYPLLVVKVVALFMIAACAGTSEKYQMNE
jgi:hypothetical protein